MFMQGLNGLKGEKGDTGLPGPQGPSVSLAYTRNQISRICPTV